MINTSERITILGAGLTGSLLALLLARRGFAVTVLERQGDPRTGRRPAGRSINLALAARGHRALQLAGLADAVAPILRRMPGRQLHQSDGTLEFQRYGSRDDEIVYSVGRAALNRMLLDAADEFGVEYRFGQQVEDYDPHGNTLTVREERGDGMTWQLRVARLIAADGAGSPIRRALAEKTGFGMSETLLEHGYKEIAIPAAADGGFRMEPEALHVWPRGGYMLIALPNPGGDFTATLFMPHGGPSPSFAEVSDGVSGAALFASQFPDVVPLVPDLEAQYEGNPVGVMGTVRCDEWHWRDQVLLIGDAAHAIVPFHGQGMNAGFEDCVVLDGLIDRCDDWGALFAAVTDARKRNADAIADMALENYIEMRDTVRDPRFHIKKAVAFELERRMPDRFIPRYSMVMFHDEIPYATAQSRGAVQAAILDEVTADAASIDDVDLANAERIVRERLAPLAPAAD
jgi:kynurenine 3-monooxygenase